MKIEALTLSLNELQQALLDYCAKHAASQPEIVFVESHDKVRITIELRPGGLVEAGQFHHRSSVEG
jgi:hypothetical protein